LRRNGAVVSLHHQNLGKMSMLGKHLQSLGNHRRLEQNQRNNGPQEVGHKKLPVTSGLHSGRPTGKVYLDLHPTSVVAYVPSLNIYIYVYIYITHIYF
jgi:hypothetical protein